MTDELVKILDGNTFVVSDGRGDIEASIDDLGYVDGFVHDAAGLVAGEVHQIADER